MNRLGDFGAKVGKIDVVRACGLALLLLAWGWIWNNVNPRFDYTAEPSGLGSNFISLSQIFSQIDKDSRLYCSGGWDQRLGRFGLRKCYNFSFVPPVTYKMTICTHDERTAQVETSDQLVAIRYFEKRFAPLECFLSVRKGDTQDYNIAPGKDSHFRNVQFPNDAPQAVAFCGCSADEEKEIASAIGATLR
jgi:hypothetical protein